jgi:hypothetical protein
MPVEAMDKDNVGLGFWMTVYRRDIPLRRILVEGFLRSSGQFRTDPVSGEWSS